ncbi:MAG: metal-dependent transcriptional regulator [Anaerolineales bacterium]|nr:metal-dependent transcriptional regulator [Chloroflexota bacterium]MBL6980417.1 metal-dependent transcriptional regulator [Anaerolineales bacterium]
MSHHNTLTESEEMYLVTIRKICENCADTPIPIPQLAEELSVLPVSVNQMIKKLADAGFVTYTPYKGVELTDEGRAISTRILRHRRLWEVFLVRELKLGLDEADVFACRLEHAIDGDVAQRLATFLGDPKVCFHGSPIYQGDEKEIIIEIRLADIKIGQHCQIVRVNADENTRAFLADEGIHAGMEATVIAINHSGAQHLETQKGNHLTVAQNIAANIIVEVILE